MAGGIGSRFWPRSQSKLPKQFIDILGSGETLIQQTYRRIKSICPPENIFVVTNAQYKELTLEQLPELTENQVIAEPARRNTAPCIAFANRKIASIDPNAVILVSPADHLILKENTFKEVLESAMDYAEQNSHLVTIGIHPSRPDTGYGYIEVDSEDNNPFKKVKKFTEKPDLEKAKEFVQSGYFSWNSGMFIWSLKSIDEAMSKHLPDMHSAFMAGEALFGTDAEKGFIDEMYAKCEDISIDYGIMEKADNTHVINADLGWSDLGTWGSLDTHLDHDENNNASISGQVNYYASKDNLVSIPEDKIAVIEGLENYIVVETESALLICKKENEQQIKQFVSDIKNSGKTEYL